MFDDRSRKFSNQYVSLDAVEPKAYEPFVGERTISALRWIADPLHEKVWANVNSTCVGGGVAEMLQSMVPFAKGLGVDCRWFVIEGTNDFFTVTKKFHNLLQGVDQDISLDEVFHAYLDTVHQNIETTKIVGHMVTIHDPQPAAVIMSGNVYGQVVWRCHIDTSEANLRIWRFLLPYINHYDGAIFTCPEFIRSPLQIPTYEISPCIDPLKPKNHQYSRKEALDVLGSLFNQHNVDPERPIVAAISRYDIHKNQHAVVEAFKKLRTGLNKKVKPYLILLGNFATDDPEGEAMYDKVLSWIGEDADVHAWVNVPNNDKVVGALMAIADCFVHVSTREGFGLVVSEAMWQGTPVIGSNVGGIRKQVINGQTGYVTEPNDIDCIARRMKSLLENKEERDHMGAAAVEQVRNNFLLPHLVLRHLLLMRYYLEIDNRVPDFRINDLTFSEIKAALYGRTMWPISSDQLKRRIETIWDGLQRRETP
jgi:trehalose synthase